MKSSAGKNLTSTFADKSTLETAPYPTNARTRYQSENEATTDMEAIAPTWRWTRDRETPILWVTPLHHTLPLPTLGNLSIAFKHYTEGRETGSRSHWGSFIARTLDSQHPDLVIVETSNKTIKPSQWLAIPHNGTIQTRQIWHDFVSLCFCLGTWTQTSILTGLDKDGVTVAIEGTQLGRPLRPHSAQHPAVPLNFDQSTTWTEKFYQRLTACRDRRLTIALELYLDSLNDSIGGSFLKLHTSLELLADLKITTATIDTDDKADAEDNRTADTTHSTTMAKPEHSNQRLKDPHVLDNLSKAAARFCVDASANSAIALRGIDELREKFLTAAAHAVDYSGPLSTKSSIPYRTDPPAERYYISEIIERKYFVPQWPEFIIESIPRDSLLSRVEVFAEDLAAKTGGEVIARLMPSIGPEGDVEAYNFEIMLSATPTVRQTVFTIIPDGESMRVQGWADDEVEITSVSDLFDFLNEVKDSTVIRRQVMTMRIYAAAMKMQNA